MENCDGIADEQNSKAICDGQFQNCDGEVRHNLKMCQEFWWVRHNPSQDGIDSLQDPVWLETGIWRPNFFRSLDVSRDQFWTPNLYSLYILRLTQYLVSKRDLVRLAVANFRDQMLFWLIMETGPVHGLRSVSTFETALQCSRKLRPRRQAVVTFRDQPPIWS